MSITRTIHTDLNTQQLRTLLGEYNKHIKYIQERLDIQITHRQDAFILTGDLSAVEHAELILGKLAELATDQEDISGEELHLIIQSSLSRQMDDNAHTDTQKASYDAISLRTRKGKITPRGHNQQQYVKKILISDVSFGVGPAGTGKTYLAVACAVDMLERGEIERILLVRPAVEAGEKLGFLPGDLTQKIDPYLRPLYDALFEMLGFEKVEKLIERNVIEVAPLAYMRGRTLNDAFIILDESQNTTIEQMKMFLTRIGFNSKAVITGDVTQIDLPRSTKSGLRHAIEVLAEVDEISFNFFHSEDVVRHPVVARIVNAYEAWEEADQKRKAELAAERKREAQEQEQK